MKKLVAVLLVLTAIMGASMCWLLGNIDVMIKVAIPVALGKLTYKPRDGEVLPAEPVEHAV